LVVNAGLFKRLSDSDPNHNVQGSWLGQYFYSEDPSNGFAFEAVFLDIDGHVEGHILDDNFMGEAVVAGTFKYPTLTFTKIYRAAGSLPVQYDGTMSEDGKELRGRWHISGDNSGTWFAQRDSNGASDTLPQRETEVPERELANVQPATAPLRRDRR
jgi:hypothetical protein